MTATPSAQEGTSAAARHTGVTRARAGHEPAAVGDCAVVQDILARVGDKWTMLVVMLLEPGALRFNEIKRRVGGISQRMLTVTVRGLERDGLVLRTVTPSTPPQVHYQLTETGRSLAAAVQTLGRWAMAHRGSVEVARRAFDERCATEGSRA